MPYIRLCTPQVFIRNVKRTRVVDSKDGSLPQYVQDDEWMLDTEGVNLMEVGAGNNKSGRH